MRRETSIGRELLLTGIGPRPLRVGSWGRGVVHGRSMMLFPEHTAAQRLTSSRSDQGSLEAPWGRENPQVGIVERHGASRPEPVSSDPGSLRTFFCHLIRSG